MVLFLVSDLSFGPEQEIYHLRKPRVLTPPRSLRVRNDVELVPLACEDGDLYARDSFKHMR